jgi:hypothetical protein
VWKRSAFQLAWKKYCALTTKERSRECPHFIGPTYDTSMAGVEKGTHVIPSFATARGRIASALRMVIERS